jgi:hypothetical protein
MGFGIRLILGGGGAAVLGVIWFFDALEGEDPESTLKGGIWKGPLLFVAGLAAVVMGVRMLLAIWKNSQDDAPAPSASQDHTT